MNKFSYEDDYPLVTMGRRKANQKATRAMKVAARLRREGYSPSEALETAWQQAGSKRNSKGGNMGELFSFDNPMSIAVLIGGALLIHKAITHKWIWEGLSRAPVSRQLGTGRVLPPVRRAAQAVRGMMSTGAQPTTGSIGAITTLVQGHPLPNGGHSETISVIGR